MSYTKFIPPTLRYPTFCVLECYLEFDYSKEAKMPRFIVSEKPIRTKAEFMYLCDIVFKEWGNWHKVNVFTADSYEEAREIPGRVNFFCPSHRIQFIDASFYPKAGACLKTVKRVFAYLSASPNNTIIMGDSLSPVDLDAWRKKFREALHGRINTKGCLDTRHRENKRALWRDQQRLNAWLHRPYNRRITHLGLELETKFVYKRYPQVNSQMRYARINLY